MKYLIKYLIDFAVLFFLYAFVFFKKWRAQGRDSLLVNTLMYAYLSLVLYFTMMPVVASIPFMLDHPYTPERKLSWLPLRAAVLPSTGACGTRSRKKVVDAAERLW